MPERSSAAVDTETLGLLQSNLGRYELVTEAVFSPSAADPRLVETSIDPRQYPDGVVDVRLDVRWFQNGDFGIHYVETHRDGTRWQCRWDRHENPHNARTHFHPPPDAADAVDIDLEPYVQEVLPTVLQWVEERIADLW